MPRLALQRPGEIRRIPHHRHHMPRRGNQQQQPPPGKNCSRRQLLHCQQLPRRHQIQQPRRHRKHDPHQALQQQSQPQARRHHHAHAADAAPLHPAPAETPHRQRNRQRQHHVRNQDAREQPQPDARRHHQPGIKSRAPPERPPPKRRRQPCQRQSRSTPSESAPPSHALRKFCNAAAISQYISGDFSRYSNPIHPRRHPIARRKHVARDLRLHRVHIVHQRRRRNYARHINCRRNQQQHRQRDVPAPLLSLNHQTPRSCLPNRSSLLALALSDFAFASPAAASPRPPRLFHPHAHAILTRNVFLRHRPHHRHQYCKFFRDFVSGSPPSPHLPRGHLPPPASRRTRPATPRRHPRPRPRPRRLAPPHRRRYRIHPRPLALAARPHLLLRHPPPFLDGRPPPNSVPAPQRPPLRRMAHRLRCPPHPARRCLFFRSPPRPPVSLPLAASSSTPSSSPFPPSSLEPPSSSPSSPPSSKNMKASASWNA